MEKLIIKKQISYSCIFPEGNIKLEDIIKLVPSRSAIEWASYMLARRFMKKIDETEHDYFFPLLFKLNKELQHTFVFYLQNVDINNYTFIDKTALLILLEHLLENHNENKADVLESKNDFSNLMIAYLLCCDERLRYTSKALEQINDAKSFISLYLPERIRYNDIDFPKDYRVEFIRFYYFMIFCEQNALFSQYLKVFLEDNSIEKWDDYLYFIFETYLTMSTNKDGKTNKIIIEPRLYYGKKYLDSMCISVESFQRKKDFTNLRSKPVYYHGDNTYSVLSTGFFLDKMFQSFLFDLASSLKTHKNTTKINGYPDLKRVVGESFTERFLFYEIIEGCFEKTCKKMISGQILKNKLKEGEPDFYMRKGKSIFLLEFKDIMLSADVKHCEDFEQIRQELLQLFELSTIERRTGQPKKKPQAKGITQLLNVIDKKLDIIVQDIDRVEVLDNFNVYPVIVYQDCCFDIEGVNYILNERFNILKETRSISKKYVIKPCVMLSIEMLIKLEDYFRDGRLQLDNLINDYILECNQSEQNKFLPFGKFVMRETWKLGYKENMSLRFQKIYNLMAERNRVKQ